MDLHQVLKILVAWPDGISESLLRAHGLESTTLGTDCGSVRHLEDRARLGGRQRVRTQAHPDHGQGAQNIGGLSDGSSLVPLPFGIPSVELA
jgi:hypothetical protein